MRIAFIAPYPAGDLLPPESVRPKYRGREHPATWVRTLCGALARPERGIELHVLIYTRTVMKRHTVRAYGATFHFIPRPDPARWEMLHHHLIGRFIVNRELSRITPDIVQGFGTESGNGFIATRSAYPSVLFIQGIVAKTRSFKHRSPWLSDRMEKIERQAVQRAGAVIAETPFAADWAATWRNRDSIHVIPHALDPAYLEIQPDLSDTTALCVGTLSDTKGTDVVIRAFKDCPRCARLVLVGGSESMDRYIALAKTLNLADRIIFSGHQPPAEIRRLMHTARLVVLGSRMDTSPNIITEAHAAGLPVVAPRAGGIPDMITDRKDGYLTEVDDAHGLASAMTSLLMDIELARQMGAQGRNKVRQLNSPERIADAHLQLYRELLNNRQALP